jgi:hypothetical protein
MKKLPKSEQMYVDKLKKKVALYQKEFEDMEKRKQSAKGPLKDVLDDILGWISYEQEGTEREIEEHEEEDEDNQ